VLLSRHYYRNLKSEICRPIYLMAATKTALCILFLLIDLVFFHASMPLQWLGGSRKRKLFPIREIPLIATPTRRIFD
jgi:hypothetical protein